MVAFNDAYKGRKYTKVCRYTRKLSFQFTTRSNFYAKFDYENKGAVFYLFQRIFECFLYTFLTVYSEKVQIFGENGWKCTKSLKKNLKNVYSTEKYKPHFTLAKNSPAFLKYQKIFFKSWLSQRVGVHAVSTDITISECVKYFAPTPATIQNAINKGIHEYRS